MTELIATKIAPPLRRPDLLERPRLLDELLKNAHRRLIIVTAPAGYGKTSLLIDFTHQLEHTAAWYAVTKSDGDLWTFARYVVGAVRAQIPNFGERSQQHIVAEGETHDLLVTTLINELYELDEAVSIIIDDFHLVEEVPEIRGFLETLIPLLPANCQLIIASRTVPDFKLEMAARLVTQRDVIGLGPEDLRFTPEEVQTFLHHAYDQDISLTEAQKLVTAAEGWITAIILTSQVRDPLASITRARSTDGQLYDYLASEVLDQLPARIRRFLLESAVLDEMEPRLVDALLDIDDAGVILEELEGRNIFLTRLEGRAQHAAPAEEPGIWYRYHSLFREFLQTRLRETDRQRYWALQQRAANILLEAGHRGQAIDHFLAAGDYEAAARAIEEETREVHTTAQADRVSRWIDQLPTDVLERYPRLVRYRARSYYERDGDPAKAIDLCNLAESVLRRQDKRSELAWVLVDKAAALRLQGNLHTAIEHCQEALELGPHDEIAVVAEAHRIIGLCQSYLGQLEEGIVTLRTALELWEQVDHQFNCALLHNDLGSVLHTRGDLTAANFHFRQALEIWKTLNDASRTAMTLNNLAMCYYQRGEYDEALTEYQQALEQARKAASRRYGAYILVSMGDVYRDMRQYDDAIDAYKRGLLDARKVGDSFLGAYGLDALGQTYHLMGNTAEGIALVRRAYEDARERKAEYEIGLYQLSAGAIAHEQGFLDEATSQLTHCIRRLQGQFPELAKANLHLAQTHYLAHRPQQMSDCLHSAEECLFHLGYDGFIFPTVLRTAGAIQAVADSSLHLSRLLEQAREKLGPPARDTQRHPRPTLKVYVLGQPRVYHGNDPVAHEDWRRQRTQELFFYLLIHPRRTTHQIGADLWPTLSRSQVTNNVHVTLSYLRKVLGDSDYVRHEEGRYSLHVPRLWVDSREFREAIELAGFAQDRREETRLLERAVNLYQGDFLEDFPITADDSWVIEEREALRRLYAQALERLVRRLTERGEEQRARRYSQLQSEVIETQGTPAQV